MSNGYRVIGSEESPFSVKVRAYLRYKRLPHTWLDRTQAGELFSRHARLPLIPLVVTADDRGLQDSTLIIQSIEADQPEPSIHPPDAIARFISVLLEEFADEWGNKWLVHYRWAREVDRLACSQRLALIANPDLRGAELEASAREIRDRMTNPVWFTGFAPQTGQQIEDSFKDALALLEPHLAAFPYLFGGRPAFADFALWGQLNGAQRDPTPRGIVEIQAPHTVAWLARMQQAEALGAFETWEKLAPTLEPLVVDQVGGLFLPWSAANAEAIEAGRTSVSVQLRGASWEAPPERDSADSLRALRHAYAVVANNSELETVLARSGCLGWLAPRAENRPL